MQAGTELDNLLNVAQFIGHEADDGRHPDAVRGWDKYKTYFTFDGKTIFEGEISIKLLERGDLFYDMTKIKDTSTARTAGTATGSNSASDGDVSTNSIRDNTENVKRNGQKSDNPDIRYSLSAVDDYTEKQYNDYGWVRVNDVLSDREYADFNRKMNNLSAEIRRGKTASGEYIIPVNDMKGELIHKRNNLFKLFNIHLFSFKSSVL